MILSVSRRTDIPSYYSEWFYNRVKAGHVFVRNPMNLHQISKVEINREVVDCMVFWTKNPLPMLARLKEIEGYPYYFQFTLNAYGKNIEENIALDCDARVEVFQRLSDIIGPDRVIWRYDPILLNAQYTIEYHLQNFERLAARLCDYTRKCTISFIDFYKKITYRIKCLHIKVLEENEKRNIAEKLVKIAQSYGLELETCAENLALDDLGIGHTRCIDAALIERIISSKLQLGKDKNQRTACGCIESIDIGMYNTCLHGCKYCYANHNLQAVTENYHLHKIKGDLLCGKLTIEDIVKVRKTASAKQLQTAFVFEEL